MDVLFDFIASCEPKRRQWCIEKVRDTELALGMDRVSGDFSDFWGVREYLDQLGKWTCPTLAVHGLNDWNVMPDHSTELYARLKQKGVPCMLFLHQGGHGGEPPFKMINRWFTRYLLGVENGVEQDARAWVVREKDRPSSPTSYPDYPNPEAKAVTLHPQKGGATVGALSTTATAERGNETFTDDVGKKGGEMAAAAQSPNRLLWASPELKEPLHLSGAGTLRIRLAADRPAVNLSVWVVSLPWTDSRKPNDDIVTRGWADPQNAQSLRTSKPLVPGEFVDVVVQLQPDDQIVPAGERIGLMVFASDQEFTLHPKPGAQVTVDLDATALTLPVVGGEAAWTRAVGAAAETGKR
jgi:X-Pro dipeptidyl-peptidase